MKNERNAGRKRISEDLRIKKSISLDQWKLDMINKHFPKEMPLSQKIDFILDQFIRKLKK